MMRGGGESPVLHGTKRSGVEEERGYPHAPVGRVIVNSRASGIHNRVGRISALCLDKRIEA
ncbi:hypothetical protein HW132_07080 [Brasilonema sp. CT11]|nr:hypothetical protein [Brasilonema sp. CT11]